MDDKEREAKEQSEKTSKNKSKKKFTWKVAVFVIILFAFLLFQASPGGSMPYLFCYTTEVDFNGARIRQVTYVFYLPLFSSVKHTSISKHYAKWKKELPPPEWKEIVLELPLASDPAGKIYSDSTKGRLVLKWMDHFGKILPFIKITPSAGRLLIKDFLDQIQKRSVERMENYMDGLFALLKAWLQMGHKIVKKDIQLALQSL